MTARIKAEHVIRTIRKSRRANDRGGAEADANARSLTRALDLLSTQLYTKPTHFILELIQNADDNTYAPGVEPVLTLVYREDGYLWVGCNEVGFSRENVEAICDINDSTKKTANAAKGYIGEKGIGFKSVFRVADTVWISSGPYTFRFERDKVLGMIVPIWCPFMESPYLSERTMFCLRIPDLADREIVKTNLLQLRTELLLFLRKLTKIEVHIYDVGKAQSSCAFALTRKQNPEPQTQTLVTLTQRDLNKAEVKHAEVLSVSRKVLEDMPTETKREGIRKTEIVLAFPTCPRTESIQPRPVYNFLPIRSYGLCFLIQADFILTSNREDIAQGNAWNQALIEAALDLFVEAVRQFNRTGFCKYDWPRFIADSDSAHGTAMAGFIDRLRKKINAESVIESQAGYFSQPSELLLVPDGFTDGLDPPRPLFDDALNTFKYASFSYSPRHLEMMGVPYQSPEQICALLKWMSPEQLAQKSSAWHVRLATSIAASNPSLFTTVNLIPLRNGEWIAATNQPFYLPSTGDDVDIPDGIDVKIVSKAACAAPERRHLFQLFGAKPLTEVQVCSLILERHRFLSLSNNNLTPTCLVSHAWYLFLHGKPGMDYGSFKIANLLGQAVSGEELYMQLESCSFAMKDYLPSHIFDADFVHSGYLTQGTQTDHSRWYKWLTDTLHVSTLPTFSSPRTGAITREFQYLIDNYHSRIWLVLLRDNWRHYELDPYLGGKRIGLINVHCSNREPCQLQDGFLATTAVLQEPLAKQYIPLIDLPDPEDLGWLNLARLGMRDKPDLEFYLTILRGVAQTSPADADPDAIVRLYKQIELHSKGHEDQAKDAVFNERLVLPNLRTTSSSWRPWSECRWSAPASLTNIECLSTTFPSCKTLFVDVLGVHDAEAADVLDEILTMNPSKANESGFRERAKALLLTLSTYPLANSKLDDRFERLAAMKLAPVRKSFEETSLLAFNDANWFLPIRTRHATCFRGKLWMLDFEKKEIDALAGLFERMGLEERQLSRHVVEETLAGGPSAFHSETSNELRNKARYISLLAPSTSQQERLLKGISDVEVFSSEALVLRRHVILGDMKVFGIDEEGRVALQRIGDSLQLFFLSENITHGLLPWHFACDSLSNMFDISEQRQALLTSILYTKDQALIEDMLERAGLFETGIER